MKNLYLIPVFILLSVVGCSSQEKTSKVVLDIGGNTDAISAATGVELSKSSASTLPSDILTVDLKITDGAAGETIFSATYSSDQAANGVSLDIPSGAGRYFSVTARSSAVDSDGKYYVYTGAVSADLQAGVETNISIALLKQELAKSATIKLTLLDPDGNSFNLTGAVERKTISVDVYIPTVAGNIFDGTNVASVLPTSSALPDLNVYSKTFQVLFVKVIAQDGGVSYIGGTTVSALSDGVNNVTVKLTNASVIKLNILDTMLATATAISVTEDMGGFGTLTIASNIASSLFTFIDGTTPAGYKTFLVPAYSGVANYSGTLNPVARTINVTVNGTTHSTSYPAGTPLKWKSTGINY